MSNFTALHVHTEYSLLDGAARITELVSRAKELGMDSLAITDHGNMFGVIKFYKECKKQGIKPIIGCEVYTAERTMREKTADKDRKIGHLILLATNETGYNNLIKIVSSAYVDGFYYKPRTDKEELLEHHEGLIALSGCIQGKVQQLLLHGSFEDAKAEALEMQQIFGEGNFYLELQDHGSDDDKQLIPLLLDLSKETGIPLAATNDSHYVMKEDARAQAILMSLQMGTTLENMKYEFKPEFYLKSEEEMRTLFNYAEDAVDITQKIADRCNFDFEFGNYHITEFEVPAPFTDSRSYFEDICRRGFKERYPDPTEEELSRLEHEIAVIADMGYIEYFLIVWDFINYAKTHNIPVGPGRGSAAGSIVAYAMGITEIDPIKNSLIFERFLNPERVSMPDIEVDFCIKRRSEVIKYVTEKYGEDKVCQIATFGTMKARMVIRDVARALDVDYNKADKLAKTVPGELGITLKDALKTSKEFKALYDDDYECKDVVDMALKLEGIPRHTSTHAAGVVIAGKPLDQYVPLVTSDKGLATQFSMTEIEELGLLKMDFLGLRNLTVIDDALRMIKQNHGKDIDLGAIDFDDPEVYKLLTKGKTVGVFQLESQGITGFMKKLKPTCFEDIVAGVSLYRPGPMDSIPKYLKNKNHPDKITYVDNHLAHILDVTYGCIVYQEQVMQIVRDLGGYSYGRSDLVRRAMSKKKTAVMQEEKEYFIHGKKDENGNVEIKGCIANGISEAAAEEIFADMFDFAQYAFNKSHATAYSVITYQTAWLKCHYPVEFMAALMSSVSEDHEHLAVYMDAAKKMRISVLLPSVKSSKGDFTVTDDGKIRYGLYSVKGVGKEISDDLISVQRDIQDCNNLSLYFEKLGPCSNLNTTAITGLMSVGAFDGIVPNIHSGMAACKDVVKNAQKQNKRTAKGQISLFDVCDEETQNQIYPAIVKLPEYPDEKIYALQKELLGTYVTGHPFKKYKNVIKHYNTITTQELNDDSTANEQSVCMAAMITEIKVIQTKSSKSMAFVKAEDINGDPYEIILFPNTYGQYMHTIMENEMFAIKGTVDKEDEFSTGKLIADEIVPIADIGFIAQMKDPENREYLKIRICCDKDKLNELLSSTYELLKEHPGISPVRVYDKDGNAYTPRITAEKDRTLISALEKQFGKENIK